MVTSERWDEGGYYLIREDGIGLAQTKSRNVARRICDALNAPNLIIGRTVKKVAGTQYQDAALRVINHAVVLAVSSNSQLIVRFPDGQLAEWPAASCKIVEPVGEAGLPLGVDGKPREDPPFRAPSLLSDDDVKTIIGSLDTAFPENVELINKLSRWQWPDNPSMWPREGFSPTVETIERAAIEYAGTVYSMPRPGRHNDVCQLMVSKGLRSLTQRNQGFVTSAGRFVNRFEAFVIAKAANQIKVKTGPNDELFSEDVW